MTTPYYQDENVTIFHGDCIEIMPELQRADVLISDPPYSKTTHGNVRTSNDLPDAKAATSRVIDFDGIDADELRRIFDIANPIRWSVFFCDNVLAAQLMLDPPTCTGFVRQSVWVKPSGAPQITGDRPAMWWESIMAFHPPGKKQWNGGGHHGNYFCTSDKYTDHPTSKPLQMVRDLADRFSNDGETILDPFMGSGTTLRAAKDLGRKAIGIELDEKYCEIAAKRMAQGVLDFGA
jgi:site-specific DNA-methyltransferase (adenine-specific)